jgi:uncharacterized membrane protein
VRPSFGAWFERFDPSHAHIARLTGLNDGVFAFALTLLAIEVRPPEHWDGTLAGLGADFRSGLLAYLVGFAILGALWARQRRVLALLDRIDATTTGLALACLAMVALMPAAVGLQVRYGDKPLSFVIYAGVFLALIVASTSLWAYVAVIRRLVHSDLPDRYRNGQLGAQIFAALAIAAGIAGFWLMSTQNGSGASPNWFALAGACMIVSLLLRRWSQKPPKARAKGP